MNYTIVNHCYSGDFYWIGKTRFHRDKNVAKIVDITEAFKAKIEIELALDSTTLEVIEIN